MDVYFWAKKKKKSACIYVHVIFYFGRWYILVRTSGPHGHPTQIRPDKKKKDKGSITFKYQYIYKYVMWVETLEWQLQLTGNGEVEKQHLLKEVHQSSLFFWSFFSKSCFTSSQFRLSFTVSVYFRPPFNHRFSICRVLSLLFAYLRVMCIFDVWYL